ncbi:MAG: pirin family protein [Flavobacteriales bacterium]|nr:pirin family protein [Flavobacteriales bacterium]
MNKQIKGIHNYKNIDGLIPGVKGQRAFPSNEFRAADPFVMLDHIGPEKVGHNWFLDGKGHDHPHRGFETLTFMFEGTMQHRDSLGNRTSLSSGSVQRMNAGSGIIHGGDMASDVQTQRFHEMQLWVNNPSSEKMSLPDINNITDKDIPKITEDNITLRLISGTLNGVKGKIETKAETQIAHLIASGKGTINIGEFPKGNNVMGYVLEGSVLINDSVIKEFQLVTFEDDGNSIQIETEHNAQLVILSGKPLNEPIVYGGPFVMNTQEEINQANIDFQNGKFGKIEY